MTHESQWLERHCRPQTDPAARMSGEAVSATLLHLPGWECKQDTLVRTFQFAHDLQTLAFVNAVGWIAHTQDHHPVLEVCYRTCTIRYCTHSINGVSENDFICAARINALMASYAKLEAP